MPETLPDLRTRVDNAILLARYANLAALDQLEAYRDVLKSDEPIIFALLRHFVNDLCKFVEDRVNLTITIESTN